MLCRNVGRPKRLTPVLGRPCRQELNIMAAAAAHVGNGALVVSRHRRATVPPDTEKEALEVSAGTAVS